MSTTTDQPRPTSEIPGIEIDTQVVPGDEETTVHLPSGRVISIADRKRIFERLRADFPLDEIEKLPKQIASSRGGEKPPRFDCKPDHPARDRASADGYYCGGYHAWSVHLDYVGHAGITMRLNEVVGPDDWSWEFKHIDLPAWAGKLAETAIQNGETVLAEKLIRQYGQPVYRDEGLWINLTILGITMPGFGDATGKKGANATKEIIGDAIRNAALRFGVATYLWSKSEAAERRKTDIALSEAAAEGEEAWTGSGSAREQAEVARGRQDNAAEASQTRPHPNAQETRETRNQTRLVQEGEVQGKSEDQWYAEFQEAKAGGPERLRSWGNMIRGTAPKIVLNAVRQTLAEMEQAPAPVAEQAAEPVPAEDLPPINPDEWTDQQ